MQTVVPFACFLSMIRPPGVQFENSLLQIAPVDKAKCPYVKDHSDIAFQLYTRHNPTTYQELVINDDEKLFASNIDWHQPTVIYFHAFMEMPDEGSGLMVREAYILRGDTNVIMVDAQRLEAGPWYFTAAENTWFIGRFAAQFIDYLVSRGLDLSKTHLIGHSLGAQAAGVAGAAIKSGKVSRITGLDPALPLFHGLPKEQRLDASDAHFVDVIHTDAGIFGVNKPMGHADFYPNGGISPQPGCELEVVIPQQLLLNNCNHNAKADGLYAFYLKPNESMNKASRFKLARHIEKLFSYLQFAKDIDVESKRKVPKFGGLVRNEKDDFKLDNQGSSIDNTKVNSTVNDSTQKEAGNIKPAVEIQEEIRDQSYSRPVKVFDKDTSYDSRETKTINPDSDSKISPVLSQEENVKKDTKHDEMVVIEDQVMTDSILRPRFYLPLFATIKIGGQNGDKGINQKSEGANEKTEYVAPESGKYKHSDSFKIDYFHPSANTDPKEVVNDELGTQDRFVLRVSEESKPIFEYILPLMYNENTPVFFKQEVENAKLIDEGSKGSSEKEASENISGVDENFNRKEIEPSKEEIKKIMNQETTISSILDQDEERVKIEPKNMEFSLGNSEDFNHRSTQTKTMDYEENIEAEKNAESLEILTEDTNQDKQKSHVVKRQKRFINFFKQSETAEQNNFLFKMLDFLLKNRKHALPVYTVMREINTLVKSANGELNHSTKERNNYIGAPPPSVIPLTYNLEIGNENKIVSFMKRLVGLTPKGDKLVISGK